MNEATQPVPSPSSLASAGVEAPRVEHFRQIMLWPVHLLPLDDGADETARRNHAEHLRATEERFYGERSGGIRDIVEWYATHRGESVWKRSAGVFIRLLSQPQLFLEGNHRSGVLLMSFILLREGKPPFVVTPANARAFFDPSTVIKKMGKRSIAMQFRMPGMKRRFGRFLKDHADARYLEG